MDQVQVLGICLAIVILVVSILLAKVFSRVMLSEWNKLASAYPAKPFVPCRAIRFTSINLSGDGLPLQINNMAHLSSTHEALGMKLTTWGPTEISLPRSLVIAYNDTGKRFIRKVELKMKDCPLLITFTGRSACFVQEWWEGD